MKVKVQYFAAVRELVGLREEILELPDQSKVGILLEELVRRHGERLKAYLFDTKTGNLRQSIQFLIGDRAVLGVGVASTILSDGVVFAIIPPVGGG